MNAKHTPGPWIVEKSKQGGFWVRQPGIAGFSIALIGQDDSEANAHLIAAAPDLLEAAQIVKNYFEACQNRLDSSGVRSAITLLSNAIAKAEGKSA